jgi:acetolactate synthase-1/2/3 large subunit
MAEGAQEERRMNGAQSLIRSLVAAGVDVCFTNPGTSEMHFVAALDSVPRMRAVLGLFEGVVTGAADGFARMSGRPAAALLHLGPGLGNGLANLHNARRAGTPVVVIVGDHARYHRGLEAPLESDITTIARNVSTWIRTSAAPEHVGRDAADAVAAAIGAPGRIATLILPADVSWGDGGQVAAPVIPPGRATVGDDVIAGVADVLRSAAPAMLLLGGAVLADAGALDAAARVCAATGARMLGEVFPTRLVRGAGVAPLERLAYFTEVATRQLEGISHLVLVDASAPVAFFAHPGRPSRLTPEGCEVHALAGPADDGAQALRDLADALGAVRRAPALAAAATADRPSGALDAAAVARTIGALLPEGAIVSDEAITSGVPLPAATIAAPRHDWLTITGGAIGQGLPVATGAAIACPERKVIALQADGSAMYTLQALWTQAREGLDVTTVVYNNASYDILEIELQRVGADHAGPRARALYDIGRPRLDFTALARGMGVPATRAETADQFARQFEQALAAPGPALIDAIVPRAS